MKTQKTKKPSKEIEEYVKKREEWRRKKELRQGVAGFLSSFAFFPAYIVVQLFTEHGTSSFWVMVFVFTVILGLPIYFLILWLWPETPEPKLEQEK